VENGYHCAEEALVRTGIAYAVDPGEGVFYGPKIDIKLKDVLGRMWQGPTIQVDFQLADRFNINYIGRDGNEHRVVMIHRVVLGSMERFIGGLIEHYGGNFPVWLAPVQAVVMPITDAQHGYASALTEQLKDAGLRVEMDDRNEKVNRKIRDAEEMKIPYMLIVGVREKEDGTISVRRHGSGDIGIVSLNEMVSRIKRENDTRVKD